MKYLPVLIVVILFSISKLEAQRIDTGFGLSGQLNVSAFVEYTPPASLLAFSTGLHYYWSNACVAPDLKVRLLFGSRQRFSIYADGGLVLQLQKESYEKAIDQYFAGGLEFQDQFGMRLSFYAGLGAIFFPEYVQDCSSGSCLYERTVVPAPDVYLGLKYTLLNRQRSRAGSRSHRR